MVERLFDRPAFRSPNRPEYRPFEIHARAFTAAQCDSIVASMTVREGEMQSAVLESGDGADIDDSTIRRSRTAWIGPTDDTWWMFERLARVAEKANRRFGFELSGFDEDLQYTVYDTVGDFYDWHQDGLDSTVATRKLSVVVALSDPDTYRGGTLELFEMTGYDAEERDRSDTAMRLKGTAVVFPSFEYHRVLPLLSGVRRSLVAWVSGPPFR